jgi:hypothetical protein
MPNEIIRQQHIQYFIEVVQAKLAVLKTWSIGSISDSIGLDGFGAKAWGAARVFRYR